MNKIFDDEYSGLVMKKNYFVVNSHKKEFKFKMGRGAIKITNNLIIGENSDFLKQINENDSLIPIDIGIINEGSDTYPNNLKSSYFFNTCKVAKVLSNSMLLTYNECKQFYKYKGDFLIKQSYNKYPSNLLVENNYLYDLYLQKQFEENKEINRIENKENYFAPIDIDTVEVFSINKSQRAKYSNHLLFHYGFIVKNLGNTSFRFKIEKL